MKILSITELRNTQKISNLAHKENEPIFVTKNGYGDLVILSLDKYEELTKNNTKYINNAHQKNFNLEECSSPFGYINVAAISLEIKVSDINYNADKIISKIHEYQNKQIIVFPELSLTSYTCGDLFLNRSLKDNTLKAIEKILKETKNIPSLFVFGAPLEKDCKLYNCAIVCFKGEILGVVPKSNIPNYNEFYEKRYFEEGNSKLDSISLFGKNIPFSTNLLFQNTLNPKEIIGIEICEDLWVLDSPHISHIKAGASIILNLSASNETIGKDEYRQDLIKMASAKGIASYIYVSANQEESTTDLLFSSCSAIYENGKMLSYQPPFENKDALATLDLDYLFNERVRMNTFVKCDNENYQIIPFQNAFTLKDEEIKLYYKQNIFLPENENKIVRYKKILKMQALGLAKRMKHVKAAKLVLGLSGGLDSTLAFLVCIECLDLLNLDHKNLIAITLPCFGTSSRTKNNAEKIAKAYNTTFLEISIKDSVVQHLKDISHDLNTFDTTYENAQARERTQVLMDYANKVNGLVVGTGDLSEIALGWSTYNGDHMSMYSVNASLPKTLIQDMVYVLAKNSTSNEVLLDILNTPISPELLPPNKEKISQITEDLIGPYQLHDFFLYLFIRYQFSVKKIYFISKIVFKDKYDENEIKKWLTKFIKRFFSQQFKRSCMPDGIKIGSVSLSPRGDWRMPSDATCETYLEELKEI